MRGAIGDHFFPGSETLVTVSEPLRAGPPGRVDFIRGCVGGRYTGNPGEQTGFKPLDLRVIRR